MNIKTDDVMKTSAKKISTSSWSIKLFVGACIAYVLYTMWKNYKEDYTNIKIKTIIQEVEEPDEEVIRFERPYYERQYYIEEPVYDEYVIDKKQCSNCSNYEYNDDIRYRLRENIAYDIY